MEVNGFVCNAKPKIGKCISLPSKCRIDRIDFKNGILDVTDKSGKEFKNCSVLHFSSRRVFEDGLYPWQNNIIKLVSKGKKGLSLKLWDNKIALVFCNVFMKLKTRLKSIFK